jgi:hypothetical protein
MKNPACEAVKREEEEDCGITPPTFCECSHRSLARGGIAVGRGSVLVIQPQADEDESREWTSADKEEFVVAPERPDTVTSFRELR